MQDQYVKFIKEFEENMQDFSEDYSNIVILGIGTDLILGDSIGPWVGTKLKIIENEYVQIYGELRNTLNFKNGKNIISNIYQNYRNPYLITIDAALSNNKKIGEIVLNKGYIKLGKAFDRSICFYSNININCIVGNRYSTKEENIRELNKMDIKCISAMSEIISKGIENVLRKVNICV